jgi:ATP-binding cassette subfamily B protein
MTERNGVDLPSLTWPASRLGEAIEDMVRQARLGTQSPITDAAPPPDLSRADEESIGQWIEAFAGQFGVEVEPTQSTYGEVEQLVRAAGPAILCLPGRDGAGERRFLALLGRGRWWIALLGPDLSIHRVRCAVVRAALCQEYEAPHLGTIDQLLVSAGVPEQNQARVRRVILAEQLAAMPIRGCWLLRVSPGAGLWAQARQARLRSALLMLIGGYSVAQCLMVLAWSIVGWSTLTGHSDGGTFLGWALLLFTAVAFYGLANVAESRLATGAGGLFKQRLLYSALQLEPEAIRHQGAGQFLGRVMESEEIELLAKAEGFVIIWALLQLGLAAVIMALGAGGWPHALLLLLWLAVAVEIGWRYLQHGYAWADTHLEMTNALVERMVGHRTRLAQESPEHWHDDEDMLLSRYQERLAKLHRSESHFLALLPRGWMVLGLAGLAWPLVSAQNTPTGIAISLAGMLLALQAWSRLATAAQSSIRAALAWKQMAPLWHLNTGRDASSSHAMMRSPTPQASAEDGPPVITGRELSFRYHDHGRFVLQACSMHIRQGERLLLEGPSGGGKSTLAALLAGLRSPESGLLLWRGYDRQTVGAQEWRRRVVAVPQFHENHVFTGTFAFNLLMGRRWPPRQEDLKAAEAVCRDLGLGDLLDHMPAGLQQMIGESGWQLSHGERSRLYMARALLQQADLLILDESFGALDPENLQRALRCVLRRAPTLLVIAHP